MLELRANCPEGRTPESRLFAGIDQRSQGWRGASVGPGACPCSAASARPVATCAVIAGRPVRVRVAWARVAEHRRAVSGPLPPPGPQLRAGAEGATRRTGAA